MKSISQVKGMLAAALAIFVMAGVCQATPLTEQSELVRSALRYESVLTLPNDFSASQRTLIAVSFAVTETGTTDAAEILEAYLIASLQAGDVLTRRVEYTWNGSAWEETSRRTNTFDEMGTRTESLWEDRIGDMWVNRDRDVNEFDGDGMLTGIIGQSWNVDHWENEDRSIFTSGGSGIPEEQIYQTWDGNDWVNEDRSITTFNGNMIESTTSDLWNGTGWDPETRITYSYDGSDRQTELLIEEWKDGGWVNQTRISYIQDGEGRVIESLIESWEDGAWENSAKNEYTLDGSGNRTVNIFSFWSDGAWELFSIDSSMYVDGKVVESISTSFLGLTSRSRTTYTYDGENLTEQVRQIWDRGTLSASSWVNSRRTTYEYEEVGTAVLISDEPAPAGYELNQNYPNPFNPSTSIRYSLQRTGNVEVTVYNMLGQAVKTLESGIQSPGVYETTWDGTDAAGHAVASGIYLYRVATDDFTETRKMLLLK